MAQPYVGELRLFAGNFAPAGWAFCNGALMPISENETLFQLIGTTYGGDGQSTFALPDLAGRAPVHAGTGPGRTWTLGEQAGVETVRLTQNQIPGHAHAPLVSTRPGTDDSAAGALLGTAPSLRALSTEAPDVSLHAESMSYAGGSQPHENMQPYLVMNYIISLFGIFPSQT